MEDLSLDYQQMGQMDCHRRDFGSHILRVQEMEVLQEAFHVLAQDRKWDKHSYIHWSLQEWSRLLHSCHCYLTDVEYPRNLQKLVVFEHNDGSLHIVFKTI